MTDPDGVAKPIPADQLRTIVTRQHHHLTSMLLQVPGLHGPSQQHAWNRFRQFLAAHEAAEYEAIHSSVNGLLDDDRGIADARRIREQAHLAEIITAAESHPPDSPGLIATLREVNTALITHFEAEEHHELPIAVRTADPARLQAAITALRHVPDLASAPTDPRSYAEALDHAGARLLAGSTDPICARPATP